MTYLYSDDIATLVSQPHGQLVSAVATLADASTVTLDVEGGGIGWSERTAPRVTANLTCKVPDLDTLKKLDPRTGVRVKVTAGYRRLGGAVESATVADLGLRTRDVNRSSDPPRNAMALTAYSDEALAIDNSPVFGATVTANSVPLAIQVLLNNALDPDPGVTVTHTDQTSTSEVDISDRWSTIRDLADQIEAAVYDNGLRQWFITPTPVVASQAVAFLKVGENGTILESTSTIERDDWANVVKIRYQWRNTAGVDQTAVIGTATATGTFAPSSTVPTRVHTEDRNTPTTQTKANKAAAALLKRYLARGRSYTLRAVAMWWVRPGDTVTVQLPTGIQERHLVSSVDFNFDNFTMTLVTRLPDGVQVVGE